MKKVLSALFAALLAVSLFAGCNKNDDNTFIVGFDSEFPPMGFKEDNEYVGFDLDLAEEVANRNGWKFKKQPIDWTAKDNELEAGTIDCVWNGFTKTGKEDLYAWTQAYMNNDQVVLIYDPDGQKESIQSINDLKDAIIGVQKESSAIAAIKKNQEFMALIDYEKHIENKSNLSLLMDLESGGIDAVVMDSIVAYYTIEKQNKKYRILEGSVGAEEFGVGFYIENTKLRDKVEKTLLEMVEDKTMAKISRRWFGEDITTLGK